MIVFASSEELVYARQVVQILTMHSVWDGNDV